MLLSNCRYVITQDESRAVLEYADVLIKGNAIAEVGKGPLSGNDDGIVIDCSDRIVMPGLINAHMHLGMSSLRGKNDDSELKDWLQEMVDVERNMSKDDLVLSARIGIKEALRSGTTTLCDMYSPEDMTIDVAKQLGARLIKIQSYFTAFGELPEDEIEGHMEKTISIDAPSTISFALGPHSIYGTTQKTLEAARSLATRKGLKIHMHLLETRPERSEFKSKHGCLPVEYLERIGFLGPDVILTHAVWLTKGELDILSKHDVKIVHCPQSNMKLAGGGVMPLAEMMQKNITVCLGTDSAASNNGLDMFREMHVAALLQKHHYWDSTKGDSQTILDMATLNAAKAYGRDDLGSIAAKKLADIITLDCNDENLQPLERQRIVSHIVHSANGMNVSEVIIDGKLVLKEKKLIAG